MQTLFQKRRIEDDERKNAILGLISDKYCRAILKTTMNMPKSAMEIASDAKIPISTVYRRLQNLHDNKLLAISGQISDDGKKFFLYKSKIQAVASVFDGSDIGIEIVPNISKDVMEAKSF